MPIDFDIDAGILAIRIWGRLTSQEFADYFAASIADPRYRSDLPRLVVIADDTTFPPSADIIALAARTPSRQIPPTARFACVATSPLAIGITSMFMGNAGLGANYQVFDDAVKAKAWLLAQAATA